MQIFQYLNKALLLLLFLTLDCNNLASINDNNEDNRQTIVQKFGQLSVNSSSIIDQNGEIVVLRGMSLFWSQWAPQYYNEETLKWLRDDWKCTIIRVPLAVEFGGYLENPDREYEKVTTVIDACIRLGIYVIVDWHDHNAQDHLQESKTFFSKISSAYGDKPNIIYEIYNEPLNVSWKDVIKPYADEVIAVIRQNDPNNLIIVGTPNWSQDVEDVINNTISDSNVAYSFHFYTTSHRQELRDKSNLAIGAGLPIFVTEWGLGEATASGTIDFVETNRWKSYLNAGNFSWCNWSVNNKDEPPSILLPSTDKLSGWSSDELSESGKYIREYLINMNSELFD